MAITWSLIQVYFLKSTLMLIISGSGHHGEVALSECMEYQIPLELEKVVISKEVNVSKHLSVIIKRQN